MKSSKARKKKQRFFRGYSIVWKYAWKYKSQVIGAFVLSSLYYSIEFFNPYLTGRLTDIFSVSGQPGIETLKIIVAIITINALDIYILRQKMKRTNRLTMQVHADFVTDMGSHLASLPMSFHNSKRMGEVINKIGNAAGQFFSILEDIGFHSIPNLCSLIIVIIIIFLMNKSLATILIIQVLLFGFVTIKKTRGITIWQKKVDIKSDKAWGHLWDYMLNIGLVKSTCNEEFERKKSASLFQKMVDTYKIHSAMWRSLSSWQRFFMRYGYLTTLCSALYMVKVSHTITWGEFVMFIGYANMAYTPLANLAHQYRTLRKGLAQLERSYRLKNLKTEVEIWPGRISDHVFKGKIEFRNVVFGYDGEDKVLDGVSFVAHPGQVVAFVGKSGVGKTSLIDLISGYYSARSGQILVDDIDIKDLNLDVLRGHIAYVPQDPTLFNDTLGFNIEYANQSAEKSEFEKATLLSSVNEFAQTMPFGFQTLVGERGVKLSGGQKQRVALARAIIRNKVILLLDEATSALDSVSERLIQASLAELVRGRTTLIIAHRLSTVMHADQIVVLDKGKVAEIGTHKELIDIEDGIYRKFFLIQSGIQKSLKGAE